MKTNWFNSNLSPPLKLNVSTRREVHKTNVCIHFNDVDKAIQEAKHLLKFSKPNDVEGAEISDKSLGKLGELSLATTQVLKQKFDLSSDEMLNALPMIDMSSSKFYWESMCPKHLGAGGSSSSSSSFGSSSSGGVCPRSRYRTITAHCNNLRHPTWGASKTPYSRYLPPDYEDGLQRPRASQDGSPLPSARLITSIVHRDVDNPSNEFSALFSSWGQILDHDMTRVAPGSGKFSHLTLLA